MPNSNSDQGSSQPFPSQFTTSAWVESLNPSEPDPPPEVNSPPREPYLTEALTASEPSFRPLLPLKPRRRTGIRTLRINLAPPESEGKHPMDLDDLKEMRESLKRKREAAASEKGSMSGKPPETESSSPKPHEPPKLGQMFLFLPEILRPEIKSDGGFISMPGVPPSCPKPRPQPQFPKLVVGVTHDGTPPLKIKNGTTKPRIGKLVYLGTKVNNSVQQPALRGESGELVSQSHVIFQTEMMLPENRVEAHAKLLHQFESAKRDHATATVQDVQDWIRTRRAWEVEFVAMLYDEHRDIIKFGAAHSHVMAALREWGQDSLTKQWGIHKPLPDVNISDYEENSDLAIEDETSSNQAASVRKPATPRKRSSGSKVVINVESGGPALK